MRSWAIFTNLVNIRGALNNLVEIMIAFPARGSECKSEISPIHTIHIYVHWTFSQITAGKMAQFKRGKQQNHFSPQTISLLFVNSWKTLEIVYGCYCSRTFHRLAIKGHDKWMKFVGNFRFQCPHKFRTNKTAEKCATKSYWKGIQFKCSKYNLNNMLRRISVSQ